MGCNDSKVQPVNGSIRAVPPKRRKLKAKVTPGTPLDDADTAGNTSLQLVTTDTNYGNNDVYSPRKPSQELAKVLPAMLQVSTTYVS